jgi:hypothetical protein
MRENNENHCTICEEVNENRRNFFEEETKKQFERLNKMITSSTFNNDIDKIIIEIGQLVKEKNLSYNSSFTKVSDILEILFPNGISFENYFLVSIIIRILDKICRQTSSEEARSFQQNENSWKDIIGYVLLILQNERQNNVE